MSMATGTQGQVKAEPNVTPMIDVMLVLLIIFMLVVPAIAAGFQAVPPQGVNLKAHPEENEDHEKVQEAVDIVSKNGVRVAGMITDQQPGTASTVAGDNPMAAAAGGK